MNPRNNNSGFAQIILMVGVVIAIGITGSAVFAQANRGSEKSAQAQANSVDYQQLSEERRAAADKKVADIKAKIEDKQIQIKQDVCERKQTQLETVAPRLSTNATTRLNTFNAIYSRVQVFYSKGQLTVDNYDELKNAVDAARATAMASVDAISATEPIIDCEDPKLGAQLHIVTQATKSARGALLAYRAALTDLISALRASAAEENAENDNTNNGGEDEGSESDSDTDNEI